MLSIITYLQTLKCRFGRLVFMCLLAATLFLISYIQAASARPLLGAKDEEESNEIATPVPSQRELIASTAFCEGVSEIPLAECQALEVLYTSTDGPYWENKADWMTTTTPCSWYGITCTGGQVSRITLSSNNLKGNIPPQLGNLSNLQYLALSANQLNGSIPPELGNLSNLQFLILFGNQLSGSIPPQLGSLINLYGLYLSGNQLTGSIPPELGNLSNLGVLYLHFNQLSGSIPPELGNLSNLDILYLNNNQLSGSIPPELGNLSKLTQLQLFSNQLSGSIPPELGNLSKLLFLYLNSNQLSGSIPPEFGNLTSLMQFSLSNNALSGEIPSTLTKLASLGPPPFYMISSLNYNRLSASDPAVVAFLNSKYINWASTQTLPPTKLKANTVTGEILISWTPISYTADGGFYEISYAPISTGVYTVSGVTADKAVDHYLVTGLTEGMTYSLRIRTYTPAHGGQQNDLWSDYTQPVSAVALYRSSFLPMIPHGDLSTENSPIFPNNYSGP